ncbi:bifunctional UDP-2,4-diacetamido-2,4,6-trideoxy-beta-L-altropyranose hydrolase/GNAT family N-acetyltransferase [Arthrobacter sp. Y-9]|uniref:bifunctional UDP-2,4-diacetamido-2,4,6-trideoxy-beta-L-altropyranose hydrolase/GNAT family N-acetyltransferase n=1 Tax=Arthrobacter sp. Y-9 TaxID=3039385 RepID=UPI00241D0742|nr:bifunctional UDP-2,4-diacetamido-2,4,6-trideoxy-beta-L-altropyranose hydrolase/GNAT family N-acetyltransferase [Arthrobacter sp. Y-9]WFR83087.1 bifunctional UDP-2,4-diacetamido-2,4,6-trideoxy-beta-L-altropyranose hydrolase/GNAT family N-acetyltransferase [Arthrobacter sp. Y-9]
MRILFRADSRKAQGLGHVVRVLALAEAAQHAGHQVFFSGDVEIPFGEDMVLALFGERFPRPQGPQELVELALRLQVDLVHIDTYEEQGPLKAVFEESGLLLSSTEDGNFGRRPAHLVIDSSPGCELERRPDDGSWRLLRGTSFTPIRPSLRDMDLPAELRDSAGSSELRVMVVMGGTDARNLTQQVAGWWAASGVESTCYVVGGGVLDVTLSPGQRLVRWDPSPSVSGAFRAMDLVISAAGTTVWELASLGVSSAVVQTVDNQRDNYRFMTENRVAVGLGDASTGSVATEAAVGEIRSLLLDPRRRTALGDQAHSIVDGQGSARVVGVWEDFVSPAHRGVSARPAGLGDASLLFEWRNDPSVRAVSRQTSELDWAGHASWVARTLSLPDRVLLIVEQDTKPVGTVRFDEVSPRVWESSITIAPAERGKGLALDILGAAERTLLAERDVEQLVAEMLTDNVASHRLFLKAGYAGGPATGRPGWQHLSKRVH